MPKLKLHARFMIFALLLLSSFSLATGGYSDIDEVETWLLTSAEARALVEEVLGMKETEPAKLRIETKQQEVTLVVYDNDESRALAFELLRTKRARGGFFVRNIAQLVRPSAGKWEVRESLGGIWTRRRLADLLDEMERSIRPVEISLDWRKKGDPDLRDREAWAPLY